MRFWIVTSLPFCRTLALAMMRELEFGVKLRARLPFPARSRVWCVPGIPIPEGSRRVEYTGDTAPEAVR
jgi:hypothetical protein